MVAAAFNLTATLVFHYDAFISDDGGSPCEAAFLASLGGIRARVLCSPSNLSTIRDTYARLNIDIEPLQIDSKDLNTKRMLDLMAVNQDDATAPLYIYVIHRILREMRIAQQVSGERFSYTKFKSLLLSSDLTPTQLAPLSQRLSVLESFMPLAAPKRKGKGLKAPPGTNWASEPGLLTIVDLSCPCITPATACSLFNVCLSIFLEQEINCGRVVALDEAHKLSDYSGTSGSE
ncbi:hypothetical protein H633G_11182 [Metarhizium anisopliae BRIP 53284]|nr:hypothetical protein H633G_11182 [Metarhizium anisopliae BRIP 53284]